MLRDIGEAEMLLGDLSRVVAEQPLSPSGPLMGAAECEGAHALWQAAVGEPEAAARAAARSGGAINALPSRLRAILGARIAKKLIESGAWSSAKEFYAAAAAHGEYAANDLEYVAARLLEHDGQGAEAEKMLLEVASGDSQASQDALIALAERYAAEGSAPDEDFVEDLGALARRAKGSRNAGAAALHEALIWSASGNVEAGVYLLQSAADNDEDIAEEASREAQKVVAKAFASSDESQRLAGLRALVNYRSLIERNGLNADIRFKAAQVAAEAGLPNLALRLVNGASAKSERSAMLIKARAALAAGDAEAALAAAASYADQPEFTEIIVRANFQLERHYAALAAASALPEDGGKAETMAEAAWRAGDFVSAARAYHAIDPSRISAPDALRYALSAYMSGETELPPAAEAALKRDGASLNGVRNLFSPHTDGPVLERGQAMAESAGEEIELIKEILGNG